MKDGTKKVLVIGVASVVMTVIIAVAIVCNRVVNIISFPSDEEWWGVMNNDKGKSKFKL